MTATRTFAYTGRDSAGKIVNGRLGGATESSIVSKLRSMNVSPLTIKEAAAGKGLNLEITIPGFTKGVKLKDVAIMSRQMATMVGAGLTLIRTIGILTDQTENKQLARVLGVVGGDIERGLSLSESLAKHPAIFPPLMIHMVRAGEAGGFLDTSLNRAADNFESDVKLRETIKSALTYPVVVLIMAIVAVIGMLTFIVPIFSKMFAGLGAQLPVPTMILVVISEQMIWLGPLLAVCVVGFMLWWKANKRTDRVRRVADTLKLKLPVFGMLFTKVAVARFARNFSTMMASGVPILESLTIVGDTSGSWVIEQSLKKVSESVRQGKSVSAPLALEPVFPNMVVQMIAVGEDSGSMEVMLSKVADFYESEVESTTKALTSLLEPLMIAFIGVVIGGMIVALYLPVFSIYDHIK